MAVSTCLLFGTWNMFGQQATAESSPHPTRKPTAPDTAPASRAAPELAGYANASSTPAEARYEFFDLKEDKNARSYYEYYDPRSYGTPSGYINPNYHFPSRNEIDKREKVDEAMQKQIIDGGKSMQEVLKLYYPEHATSSADGQVADLTDGHPLSLDKRAVVDSQHLDSLCAAMVVS